MLIEGADYFVRLVPFPPGRINAAVSLNEDGTYNIYIDSNADDEHKKEAFEHEIQHIEQDHFYSDKPIKVIEAEADGKIAPAAEETPPDISKSRSDEWVHSWAFWMQWAENKMHEDQAKS